MERRRPKPPSLKAPLSASSVEMMDFAMFHLMFHTNRVQETYIVSPSLETASPACRRFSTSGFFSEFAMNSLVLFTLKDPELNAVCNGTADI